MRVKRGVRTTMFGVLTLFQFSAAFLRKYTSASALLDCCLLSSITWL